MRILDVEQGSPEWMEARVGRPTASRFDSIMTTAKLQPAKTNYRAELVAEYILAQPLEWGSTKWSERGNEEEADARKYYSIREDVDVQQVGLVIRDDGLVAGSPDGLIGQAGGLEIKTFGAAKHMQYVLGEEKHPVGQVQGLLYLTGREWWDILYYNAELPKCVHRVHRDEKWVAAFIPILGEFLKTLEANKKRYAGERVPRPWMEQERTS